MSAIGTIEGVSNSIPASQDARDAKAIAKSGLRVSAQ
jgi:hypothetical protein